jgi:hypothetical protein
VDCALLRFDGYSCGSVGFVSFGGVRVRGFVFAFWVVRGDSTFEAAVGASAYKYSASTYAEARPAEEANP